MTSVRLPLFPLNSVLFPGLVLPLNVFEARYRALMRDLLKLPEDERRFGVVAIRDGREVAHTGLGLPDTRAPRAQGAAAGFGADPMRAFHHVGCVADAATIREKDPDLLEPGSPGAAGADAAGLAGAGNTDEAAEALSGASPDGAAELGAEDEADDHGYEVLATGTTRFRLESVDASGPYLVGEVTELEEDEGDGAGALASGVERAFRAYQQRLAWANERTLSSGQELPDEPSVLSYLVAAATVLDVPAKQRLLQAPDTATRLADELKMLRRETALIGRLPSLPSVDLTRHPTHPN